VLLLSGNNSGLTGGFTIGRTTTRLTVAPRAHLRCASVVSTALGQGTITFNGREMPRVRDWKWPAVTITNPFRSPADTAPQPQSKVSAGRTCCQNNHRWRGRHSVSDSGGRLEHVDARCVVRDAGDGGRNLSLRGTGNGTVSGAIIGSSSASNIINKAGSGTWTFAGTNGERRVCHQWRHVDARSRHWQRG
jgi:hypothetical protein